MTSKENVCTEEVLQLEAHVPFPRRTASPLLQLPSPPVSSSIQASPARSQTSTTSSTHRSPSSASSISSFFRPSTIHHPQARSPFALESALGQHRSERSGSSAASVSSAYSYSSAASHQSEDTPVCDPPTVELNMGTLTSYGRGELPPGVTPAFLVISVINHILFSRGALDMPLRLEPLLSAAPDVAGALETSRSRTQSFGSIHTGGGSRGRGKQNKLIVSLHKLHANLLSAFNAIYANGLAASFDHTSTLPSTSDARVSILISFGASPLSPKEHLHIALTLPDVPNHPASSARAPDTHAHQPVERPVQPTLPSNTRLISKSLTALQRKVLRFIVSEDSLQPEVFSTKLPNRMHVMLNVHRASEASIVFPASDAMATMTRAGEESVERQGTFFPPISAETDGIPNVAGDANVDADMSGLQVPKGWSFRRNARIPLEVIRLQDHLRHPFAEDNSNRGEGSSAAVSAREINPPWTTSFHSRSGSPCSTADEYRSCYSSTTSSSRLGSVSPTLPPVDDEDLLPQLPVYRDEDGIAAAAAEDMTVPPASQPHSHSQTFIHSAGSSTPTALPFAPSPLRRNDNGELAEENVSSPHSSGTNTNTDTDNSPHRPNLHSSPSLPRSLLLGGGPKSRLRGGFVLLRKTTSSTFPQPHLRASRGPRLSGASSLSLSFSAPSVGEDEGSLVRREDEEDGVGQLGRMRSQSALSMRGRAMQSGLSRSGRRSVPVHALVLDLRSNRASAGAGSEEQGSGAVSDGSERRALRGSQKGEEEQQEPQWWICDTVLSLK
ncbi:unnamed protein product [Tilletia laevis]|uniref:Uncharacterized protein n=4 Tax=Tilletia TaxID=13289 RepID=A0A8X7MSR3_9BASI|nr:hypothetical protein CF335_g2937 [Tilletia laevis]KAE8203952.1 hypothetical protein CF328_g1368 [Tilletia controversa]KAE8261679.1 hypothetical protein A4X03_0g3059 [Tilletia caries]KAE8247804.1 hypothetical protein A4X06_0g4177 [Tilletia controversa]CAD6893427.1 unnamed protein product [Tilletia caries]